MLAAVTSRVPHPDDDALLARRRGELAAMMLEARESTRDLVHALAPDAGYAETYRQNLRLAVDDFGALLRDADRGDLEGVHLQLAYLIGEYLIQRFGARWSIDDVPMSPTFGHVAIDVPLSSMSKDAATSDAIARVLPFELALQVVRAEPPRSVADVLAPRIAAIECARGA
jgi:hypothetical protein